LQVGANTMEENIVKKDEINDSERREVANWQEKNSIIKEKEVVKLLMINKRSFWFRQVSIH
jgi:hypothetical protein